MILYSSFVIFPEGGGKRKMEKWFIWFASPVSEVDHFLVPELSPVNIGALTDQHDACLYIVCHHRHNKLSKVGLEPFFI